MPLFMQAKLLRVLESGEFRRIGGTDTLRADVRLISATNNDLLKKVSAGEFRHDLYYRIAGIDLRLPSLKERNSDIPELAQAILKRITRVGMPHYKLAPAALEKLQTYAFPGNIRELKNILLKAVSESNNGIINVANIHLSQQPDKVAVNTPHEIPIEVIRQATDVKSSPNISIAELEAEHISKLLLSYNGHRRNVADTLGISERTLYRKLKRYNLA
jgi:two-component system, NtrC family, response regulator AtoC